MLLTINRDDKSTLFRQIFEQLSGLMNDGTLGVGEQLPSTRELARSLGVNRTTIMRVYEELWAQGYIESTPGSYTRVRKRQPALVSEPGLSAGENELNANVYRATPDLAFDQMMPYLENGKRMEEEKINFLQLSPDTRLLDNKQVKASMKEVLNRLGPCSFGFAHARGHEPLRREIVKHMKLHSIDAEDKNILVTNSSLQSLQLIFQVFSKPGDIIVTEMPTYSIVLQMVKIFRLHIIEIPMTSEGMNLEMLEEVLQKKKVRFIYTMPAYQNPTGISMPQKNKDRLLQICRDKDCIVIEDSIEEELRYQGKTYLPLKSIDRGGQVIYLGTFTKVMAPGLRVGWIIATPECIKKLTVLKSIFEISSGTLNQVFLSVFFNRGAFELQLRKNMREFRKRMKIAVSSMKKYIPAEKTEWNEPSGGYMIWLKLLTKKRENIEQHFYEYGTLIHNGQYFFSKVQPYDYIRICISQLNESEIEEGIKRIGNAIKALD